MKASDLKALLSFAPLALLEPLFERRGEELDSAPLESPSSLSPPLSPYLCYGPLKCIRGPPLLLFLRSFKTQNNTTIDMPAMPSEPTMMPWN